MSGKLHNVLTVDDYFRYWFNTCLVCFFSCKLQFKGRSRAQNLVPVTVAQILNASNSEDRFFSGVMEISQVMYDHSLYDCFKNKILTKKRKKKSSFSL